MKTINNFKTANYGNTDIYPNTTVNILVLSNICYIKKSNISERQNASKHESIYDVYLSNGHVIPVTYNTFLDIQDKLAQMDTVRITHNG